MKNKPITVFIFAFLICLIKGQICGDCVLDWPTETCDDCNIWSADGCDSTCQIETGYYCIHTSSSSVCSEECGDGINVIGTHPCDDGNRISRDGCSSTCQLEAGFTCTGYGPGSCVEDCDNDWKFFLPCDISTPGCILCALQPGYICIRGKGCSEPCGNSNNYGTKDCEDGMAYGGDEYYGDGCSWKCEVEPGFNCPVSKLGVCTEICGADTLGGTYDFYYYPCDDGNNVSGDGCTDLCQVETGYECYDGTPLQPDTCYEICGDGIDLGMWWCDDGNKESGDGCSSTCQIERGYSCTGGTSLNPDICTEICGDGIDHHFYECDDGNLIDGDGCTSTCTIEPGWECIGGNFYVADKCQEVCGDGLRIDTKPGKCDDGNKNSGDGCSKLCDIETGWQCIGGSSTSKDTCTEICGDGINAGGVECDDGNNDDGDGCSSTCTFEKGFKCSGGTLYTKDVCEEICGDGLNYKKWECDDGNTKNGDGCDSTCKIETGWYCFGGDTNTRDVCRLKPQPKVEYITLDSNNTLVTVKFNETIILNDKWTKAKLNVYIEGPKGPYSMSWDLQDSEFYTKQPTDTFLIPVQIFDQIYSNLNQILVVKFVDQNYYQSFTTTRPLLNYTAGVQVNMQPDTSTDGSNQSWYLSLIPIIYISFGIFVFATAIFAGLSMTPFIYLTATVQMLQLTSVMQLMWPTSLQNFFYRFRLINFETDFIQRKVAAVDNYSPINDQYTNSGYASREFLYNSLDALLFCGVLIALIPVLFTISKLVKIQVIQKVSRRYYINIIQDAFILIYLKISLSSFLHYDTIQQFSVNDKTQGVSAMLNLIISFFILFGFPALHILLLLKRACLNRGIDKKFAKKKSILERAHEHQKEEEEKEQELVDQNQKENQTSISKYLMFLKNPFASLAQKKVEEEEQKKKEEEIKKKKKENGDDYTDSGEEDDMTDDQRKQMIDATKKYNEYRFKKSFLYQMCWGEFNDHYYSKLLFYIAFPISRLIYAYILNYYANISCKQVQYFMMINVVSLACVMQLRSFKQSYLYHCVVVDEFFKTFASATYFAFYHTNSPKNTVEYFTQIIFWSIIFMILLNIIFIVKELLKRSKGDMADLDIPEPQMPKIQKKEKKKDINVADGDESDTSIQKKTPKETKKPKIMEETEEGESDELISEELSVQSYSEEEEEDDDNEGQSQSQVNQTEDDNDQEDSDNSMNIGAQDVVVDDNESKQMDASERVEDIDDEEESEEDDQNNYVNGNDVYEFSTFHSNNANSGNLGLENAQRFMR